MTTCITRDQQLDLGDELLGKDKHAKVNAQGLWEIVEEAVLPKATFPTDLAIRAGFQRRSMAADVAGICDFAFYL